ncbi:MAG: hypothetical protein EXS09_04775 [Gemmataceae bacterium]|nr:hypothetical protein [Gemmataceae bacterium]
MSQSGSKCFLLFIALLVGCSQKKSTPAIEPLPPIRPFLEVQPRALEMLRRIASGQKNLGDEWYVRLEVVWKPTAKIEVQIDKKAPGPTDFMIEADGLKCVMAIAQKPYLKGAYIEVVQSADKVYFDVTFPNQDEHDRAAASKWLRMENARRDEQTAKDPKGKDKSQAK